MLVLRVQTTTNTAISSNTTTDTTTIVIICFVVNAIFLHGFSVYTKIINMQRRKYKFVKQVFFVFLGDISFFVFMALCRIYKPAFTIWLKMHLNAPDDRNLQIAKKTVNKSKKCVIMKRGKKYKIYTITPRTYVAHANNW